MIINHTNHADPKLLDELLNQMQLPGSTKRGRRPRDTGEAID